MVLKPDPEAFVSQAPMLAVTVRAPVAGPRTGVTRTGATVSTILAVTAFVAQVLITGARVTQFVAATPKHATRTTVEESTIQPLD